MSGALTEAQTSVAARGFKNPGHAVEGGMVIFILEFFMLLSAPAVVGHHKRRLGMHWGPRSMCFHTSVSQIHTSKTKKHENAEKWMLG